jgi:hypothetical protein
MKREGASAVISKDLAIFCFEYFHPFGWVMLATLIFGFDFFLVFVNNVNISIRAIRFKTTNPNYFFHACPLVCIESQRQAITSRANEVKPVGRKSSRGLRLCPWAGGTLICLDTHHSERTR